MADFASTFSRSPFGTSIIQQRFTQDKVVSILAAISASSTRKEPPPFDTKLICTASDRDLACLFISRSFATYVNWYIVSIFSNYRLLFCPTLVNSCTSNHTILTWTRLSASSLLTYTKLKFLSPSLLLLLGYYSGSTPLPFDCRVTYVGLISFHW